MNNYLALEWSHINDMCHHIVAQLARESWVPDYVVGIVRGGAIPGVMISHALDIPCYTLNVRLRDGVEDCETNAWMSEDAYGHDTAVKNILIVDDINDTGATLNWIRKDWGLSCMPDDTEHWDNVWGNNVRVATLINNVRSDYAGVQYSAYELDRDEDPRWVIFPWEIGQFSYGA